MELDAIMGKSRNILRRPPHRYGGEPLLQTNTVHLLKLITDRAGNARSKQRSILIRDVPEKVRKIVDVKTRQAGIRFV